MNSKQTVLQLRVEGSRKCGMGHGSSQLLTHTWIMKMAQKLWYITEKGMKSEGRKKNRKDKGGWRKTTVEKKGRILNH